MIIRISIPFPDWFWNQLGSILFGGTRFFLTEPVLAISAYVVNRCLLPTCANIVVMNDEVRAAVAARLENKHMSRADLARALSKTPQEITRALNGGHGGGEVPKLWEGILAALDLELTAQPTKKHE